MATKLFKLETDSKGQTIAKFGSGSTECNRFTISSFASSLSSKMKTTKVLIAFNLNCNQLRDIAMFSAFSIGYDSRFIDEPIPLPYFSNYINDSGYLYGIYLKYLSQKECEIICLEEEGHKMGQSMVDRFKYKTPNTKDKREYVKYLQILRINDLRALDLAFINALKNSIFPTGLDLLENSQITFVHSALSGCTARVVQMCFLEVGLKNFFFVDDESVPKDSAVDTFGNKTNSLKAKAEALAQQRGATIIFLNNSDGTKILVYEYDGNKFTPFTEQELTLLFGWWALIAHKFKREYLRRKPETSLVRRLNYEKKPIIYDCDHFPITENLARIDNLEAKHCGTEYHILNYFYSEKVKRFDKVVEMASIGNNVPNINDLPVPILLAVGKDYQFMTDPEIIPIWDGILAAIHIAEMAIYLRAVDRTTLRNHLTSLKINYRI